MKIRACQIVVVAAFILLSSCISNPSRYGKIRQYSTSDKKSLVFSVDDNFLQEHENSKKDENYSLMTQSEVALLKALMMEQNYCLNSESKPDFKINSRQEKIYDVTFAHLIEQSYNARVVAPRMYFGECR